MLATRPDAVPPTPVIAKAAGSVLIEFLLRGSVLHAVFIGVLVKWFMDPEQALPARELATGLRDHAEHMVGPDSRSRAP